MEFHISSLLCEPVHGQYTVCTLVFTLWNKRSHWLLIKRGQLNDFLVIRYGCFHVQTLILYLQKKLFPLQKQHVLSPCLLRVFFSCFPIVVQRYGLTVVSSPTLRSQWQIISIFPPLLAGYYKRFLDFLHHSLPFRLVPRLWWSVWQIWSWI